MSDNTNNTNNSNTSNPVDLSPEDMANLTGLKFFWKSHGTPMRKTAAATRNEIAAKKGVKKTRMLSVTNSLTDDQRFKDIVAADAAFDAYCREVLTPWGDNTGALLAGAPITSNEFLGKVLEFYQRFLDAVEVFCNVYDSEYPLALQGMEDQTTIFKAAKEDLGDLYDINNYPPPKKLRNKFGIVFDYDDLDIKDKRVALSPQIRERLRAQEKRNAVNLLGGAINDVWERLYESLSILADSLNAPNGRVQAKSLEKLSRLADLADAWGKFKPALCSIATAIRSTIIIYAADDLSCGPKGDKTARAACGVAVGKVLIDVTPNVSTETMERVSDKIVKASSKREANAKAKAESKAPVAPAQAQAQTPVAPVAPMKPTAKAPGLSSRQRADYF